LNFYPELSRVIFRISVPRIPTAAALNNEHTAIILGYLTLLSAIMLLASCRVIPSILHRFHQDPMKSRFYRAFNKWHNYYWWIFGITLILHFMTAFFHTSFPVSSDPEAPVHWVILALGFSSLLFFIMVLFSCRIITTFWDYFAGKSPMGNSFVKWFYSRHGLWWWLFILSFVAHVAVAYAHTGIWPSSLAMSLFEVC
jgi:hypothetical protein